MVTKLLIPIALCVFISTNATTQNIHKYDIGLESQFLLAGEINASFDFLIGARAQYHFNNQKRFSPLISIGLATDIANADSRIIAGDLMLGSEYILLNKLSAILGLGGQYLHETHNFQIIEGSKTWQKSSFGVTTQLGLKYHLTSTLSSTFFAKQINFNYTSIGLGIYYSF